MTEVSSGDIWPGLAGDLTSDGHHLAIRVYYEDTDFSGVVYHANYLKFLERGRSDFLRLLGIQHAKLAGDHSDGPNLAFAVRHMEIDFLKAARIDDVIEVHTFVSQVKGARIILIQHANCKHHRLVTASVTVALVDASGKPKRLPPSFQEAFSRYISEPT